MLSDNFVLNARPKSSTKAISKPAFLMALAAIPPTFASVNG